MTQWIQKVNKWLGKKDGGVDCHPDSYCQQNVWLLWIDSEVEADDEADHKAEDGEGEAEMEGGGGGGEDSRGDGSAPADDPDNTTTEKSNPGAETAYNPLIVRRSQRAIKPTKDIDLYLLGAQFGVDVEGSGADSSDLEFAPETASDG